MSDCLQGQELGNLCGICVGCDRNFFSASMQTSYIDYMLHDAVVPKPTVVLCTYVKNL